jgi:hypothetical protein
MSVSEKNYVTFYSPGTFFCEQTTKEISCWDAVEALKLAKQIIERHGAKPYGFRFETRLVSSPVDDHRGGSLTVNPKTISSSGIYFITGDLVTIDQVVARSDKDQSILISNMRCNEHFIVIENRNSYLSTLPFSEKDVIVDWEGNIIKRGDSQDLVDYRAEALKRFAY